MKQQQNQLINFISNLYMQSCRKAKNKGYDIYLHEKQIKQTISKSKFSYKQIQKIIPYEKNDFIADLIEVTTDMKIVNQTCQKNYNKFIKRARMHFGGQHYVNFQKYLDQKRARNVRKMYEQQPFQWNQQKQQYFTKLVYQNCAYVMGLTKGNAVILSQKHMVSCAHVFLQDKTQNIFKLRCFSTPTCGYGVVLTQQSGIYKDSDISFGTIIAYEGPNLSQIPLKVTNKLNFEQFKPISIIQIGLFFIPDECLQTFETAQGFIQRNEYRNLQDISLAGEMGKLIHNCYGMWGTSGSPLWDSNGKLIGIHNAWNQEGHNVSMIVRDDDQSQIRAIRQYQRRAISIHVIKFLYEKWKLNNIEMNMQMQSQEKIIPKSKLISKLRKNVKY